MSPDTAGEVRVAALARAYLDADYRWEIDRQWHDLMIGQPTPKLEQAQPQAGCFAFLSAFNPWSVELSAAENRAADDALHARLLASGKQCRPAFASAPNRTWREPSWLVIDLESAALDILLREFGQLGSLWWRAGQPVRLRMDASRPAGLAGDGFIDWLRT